ncbi:MAG: Rrf2 family transcriptional regulator [Candidatus Nomurabacteria bacterium]|nr:MAG: Rrf2 family transcriptional regulator [Candidatus Nomurabacteria bacterium]
MKFSTKGDYGLALMLGLARQHGQASLSLRNLAEQERVPYTYAEQLMVYLRQAGLVESSRGSQGGYRLTRSPKEINVGEILHAVHELDVLACERSAQGCPRQDFCTTHDIWVQVREAMESKLSKMRLDKLLHTQVSS